MCTAPRVGAICIQYMRTSALLPLTLKMPPITLLFAPSMRVGGEVLQGEVELRFPQILQDEIEEVHVKLRGKVSA